MSDNLPNRLTDEILNSTRSRKHFLTGAVVAAASFGLAPIAAKAASVASLTESASMTESTATILNVAATAEAAAVTALYHVHEAVNHNKLHVSGIAVPVNVLVGIVRAALREEQDHLAFLMGAGAKPMAMSFSFPPIIFQNARNTLAFFETAETIFIGAYMAATQEFAEGRLSTLARYSYQIGGVECEHRALMRAGLGQIPANNKSFETHEFKTVGGAAKKLESLGILKPNMHYPGAAAVDRILSTTGSRNVAAGVQQRHP